MHKVILDTNVVISALIQYGAPYKIINEFVLENKIHLCISKDLVAEYINVISRPKFSRYTDFFHLAELLIADIQSRATLYVPTLQLDIISDKDDNKILELADVSNADYIITGNTRDFTMEFYKTTRIISPADYYELFC
ncbi:MAG: putative toxin-antitoxin system toxin component, PIN family [Candidatus Kapaibacterium sp.]